jgi:hypothetical protein
MPLGWEVDATREGVVMCGGKWTDFRRIFGIPAILAAMVLLAACRAAQDGSSDTPTPPPIRGPEAAASPLPETGPTATPEPKPTEPAAAPGAVKPEQPAEGWQARIEERDGRPWLLVQGPVTAPTPGHDPLLEQEGPIEGGTLRLSVGFQSRPGFWTQVLTRKTARYEAALPAEAIRHVEIIERGKTIEMLPVVH